MPHRSPPAATARSAAALDLPLTAEAPERQEENAVQVPEWAGMSYDAQYDDLFSQPLNVRKVTPKPDPEAQAQVPGAKKVPFSSVFAKPRTKLFFNREFTTKDKMYAGYMTLVHAGALLAPFYFR